MKKLIWLIAVVVLLSAISACEKEPALEPEPVAFFSCKINGEAWESAGVNREVLIRGEELPGVFFKTLIISGTSKSEELVTIHIYNMYEAAEGDCPGVYTYYGSEHELYEEKANHVTVDGIRYGDHSAISYFSATENSSGSGFHDILTTVTSCDDYKVSGTFEGTIQGQSENGPFALKITEGVFENVPYVIEE